MTSVGGRPARPVAGAELAGTGGGRPRRQLQAGQHWCRAQAWAKEDLLGRCEQPRTKAEAAELTSTPAADLGDGHGQGRTGTVLRRGRRLTCSAGASSRAPRWWARLAAAAVRT
jgi:hypothetical protein